MLGPKKQPPPIEKPKPEDDWRLYKPGFEINGNGQIRTKGYAPPPDPPQRWDSGTWDDWVGLDLVVRFWAYAPLTSSVEGEHGPR